MSSRHQPTSLRSRSRARQVSAVLACAVVTAVAVLSFLPTGDKRVLHTTGRYHSLGHVLVFSVIAFLAVRGSRSIGIGALVLLGALLFGFGLEFGEHTFFGGGMEWTDVLADGAGVAGGAVAAVLTRWL